MGKEETCKPTGNINCLNTFYVVLKLPDLECAMVYGNRIFWLFSIYKKNK